MVNTLLGGRWKLEILSGPSKSSSSRNCSDSADVGKKIPFELHSEGTKPPKNEFFIALADVLDGRERLDGEGLSNIDASGGCADL